jgi:fucose permease
MCERLHIDLAQQGNLFLLLYLGIFVASMFVGPLIDNIGNKAVLFTSSVLVGAAMVLFGSAHTLTIASIAALLLGVGGGGLNTSTNVLVSDLYGENRGPMLNLLGIFFGIGALCIPLLAASIEGHFTIPQLLLFCAALSAVCSIAYAALTFPPRTALRQGFSLRETLGVAKYPGVMFIAILLFFESGNEACIGGWTSTYASASGFSPRTATLVLAGYWAALMLSRMMVAFLFRTTSKTKLVLMSALLSLVGCVILLLAHSLPALVLGVTMIGLSYGPIFPTALAIAGDRYTNTGTVFGLLFSIALLGGMFSPWTVGQFSQHLSVRTGMVVPLIGAVGIVVLSALMIAQETRKARSAMASDDGGRSRPDTLVICEPQAISDRYADELARKNK